MDAGDGLVAQYVKAFRPGRAAAVSELSRMGDEGAGWMIRLLEGDERYSPLFYAISSGFVKIPVSLSLGDAVGLVSALGETGSGSALEFFRKSCETKSDGPHRCPLPGAGTYLGLPVQWEDVTVCRYPNARGAMKRFMEYTDFDGKSIEGYDEPRSYTTFNERFHAAVSGAMSKLGK